MERRTPFSWNVYHLHIIEIDMFWRLIKEEFTPHLRKLLLLCCEHPVSFDALLLYCCMNLYNYRCTKKWFLAKSSNDASWRFLLWKYTSKNQHNKTRDIFIYKYQESRVFYHTNSTIKVSQKLSGQGRYRFLRDYNTCRL